MRERKRGGCGKKRRGRSPSKKKAEETKRKMAAGKWIRNGSELSTHSNAQCTIIEGRRESKTVARLIHNINNGGAGDAPRNLTFDTLLVSKSVALCGRARSISVIHYAFSCSVSSHTACGQTMPLCLTLLRSAYIVRVSLRTVARKFLIAPPARRIESRPPRSDLTHIFSLKLALALLDRDTLYSQ